MKRLHIVSALLAGAVAASAASTAPVLSGSYTNGAPVVVATLSRAHGALPQSALPQGTEVLYDQYDNDSGKAPVSQDFEAGFETYDNAGADDFVVPGGGWTITNIDAKGLYFSPPTSGQLGPALSFNVTFYADGGGQPGAAVATLPGQSYTDTQGTGSVSIMLGAPVELVAGRYWVSIAARMDILVGGEWGWGTRTVQTNAKAMWQNPGDGFGTHCTTWMLLGPCIPTSGGPDYMFRLHGTANGNGGTEPVASITPAALSLAADADASATVPLHIANVGGGTLTWSLAEATADALPSGGSTVLYEQYDNGADQPRPPISQDFGPGYEPFTNAAADDFVVPKGGWIITGIDAQGLYYSGTGPALSFAVTFYADAGGTPGALVTTLTGQAYADAGTGSPSIVLSAPVPLDAGTYWVSVVARMNIESGMWGWASRLVAANANAVWQNPGAGLVLNCPTWNAVATCFPTVAGPDFIFRLHGTPNGAVGGCSNPSDVPWLSVNPVSGSVGGGGATQSSTVTVNPAAGGLAPGDYSAQLCVTTNDPTHALVAVPVSLTVTAAGSTDPVADVTPGSLSVTVDADASATTPLHVANTGGGTLTWSLAEVTAEALPTGTVTVLYDQNNSDANQATLSQDWEDTYPNYLTRDTLGADDFVVTAGGWTVSEVDVTGMYWNGPGPVESFNVTFYADAGGLPGAVVATRPTQPYVDPTGFGSAQIALSSPVTLPPGRYWLSVQARMDFDPRGQWGWEDRSVQTGSMAAFANPGDGWGTGCATWGAKLACVPSAAGPDFMFRLLGTAGDGGGDICANPGDVPWLSVNPTSGSVVGGATQEATVTVDPTAGGLAPGDYAAHLCVTTNDPAHALVALPVSVTVTGKVEGRLFCSGFEDGEDGSCGGD